MNINNIREQNSKDNKIRLIVAIVISIYFIYYCFTYTDWHFIDNINLIIHEAGHALFIFFGDFIYTFGGTFFQVMFPFIFVLYFLRKREYFSASLLLFWVGQSIINVSVYASDAIVMQLPLIGGEHDWNHLLDMTGLLNYTKIIGTSIFAVGITVIIFAICFSLITSTSKKDEPLLEILNKI